MSELFGSNSAAAGTTESIRDPDSTPHCATFAFSLSFVVVGATCAFGLAGNSLAIATLSKDHSLQKSETTLLLGVLAVADIVFLVPVIVVIMVPSYCAYYRSVCSFTVLRAIPYIEQYGWAAASTSHMTTVYITVLVALHRYVYVCRPEVRGRVSGQERAKVHVAVIVIFAIVYNLLRVFEYEIRDILPGFQELERGNVWKVPGENGTTCWKKLVFTRIGESGWFQIVYKNVCFYLFMYLIPLTVLVLVSIKLLGTLRSHKHANTGGTVCRKQQKRDDNVTVILVIIIVLFIVCQTPTVVQRLVLTLSGAEGFTCGHPYYYLERSADYLAIVNACLNFVVYVLFSRRFRHSLVSEVLCFRRRGETEEKEEYRSELAESYRLSSGNTKDLGQIAEHPSSIGAVIDAGKK